MGYVRLKEAADFFLTRLVLDGKLSIRECIESLKESSVDEGELSWPFGMVMLHLREAEVIRPVKLSEVQEQTLKELSGQDSKRNRRNWNTADEEILHCVEWEFTEGWQEKLEANPIPDGLDM